jgi:hypothetical protein
MGITYEGLATLYAEMEATRPTLVVHPEDEEAVRRAAEKVDFAPKIEVSQLVEPGKVLIFRGMKWPPVSLGDV